MTGIYILKEKLMGGGINMIDYDEVIKCIGLFCAICSKGGCFSGNWDLCIKEAKEKGWVIYLGEVKEDNVYFCSKECAKEYNLQKRFSRKRLV